MQALYEKQMAPLETLVRQLGLKEEDPTRWEPVRRAADNIIREKNMIIEKLRQRVLELEEDLKMTDNKLRHALLATDDKAEIVQQKVKVGCYGVDEIVWQMVMVGWYDTVEIVGQKVMVGWYDTVEIVWRLVQVGYDVWQDWDSMAVGPSGLRRMTRLR